jgi:tetratricopeptide (TPR) repeat protein
MTSTTTPPVTHTHSSQGDFLKNAKKDLQSAGLDASRLDATQLVIGEGLLSSLREPKVLGVAIAAVVATVLGYSLWNSHQATRLKAGNDAFYLAQKGLDDTYLRAARTQLGLPAEAKKEAPAPDGDKKQTEAEKAAEGAKRQKDQAEATQVNAELEKIKTAPVEVDAVYAKQVKQLREVVAEFGSIRPGFEARMELGGLYYDHGAFAKAVSEYEAGANSAPTALDRALAWNLTATARESAGQSQEAFAAFEKAAASGEPTAQADALFGIARTAMKLDRAPRAREALEQVKKQFAESPQAARAESLLSEIPAK